MPTKNPPFRHMTYISHAAISPSPPITPYLSLRLPPPFKNQNTNTSPAVTLAAVVPLLPPLVADPEAIVRQNVAAQLLPLGVVLLQDDDDTAAATDDDNEGGNDDEGGYAAGYHAVANTILPHLFRLLRDSDPDTRRCASDSLSSLCRPMRRSWRCR